jgi:endonuclease/exonuclease/phosphatase family metal-dependent hydrolase
MKKEKVMKRIQFIFLYALLCSAFIFASSEFTLMTWNVLGMHATDLKDFPDIQSIKDRPGEIRARIIDLHPDIVCLQEVSPDDSAPDGMFDLSKQDPLYKRVAFEMKGGHGGCAIFCNREKFDVLWQYGIGLTDKPGVRVQAKLGGGAAACALLRVKNTDFVFLVCSVHLARANKRGTWDEFQKKHLLVTSEEKGVFQLKSLISQLNIALKSKNFFSCERYPVIWAGDFNTMYEEVKNEYCPAFKMSMFEHELLTVHNKDGMFASIDHILYRPQGFLQHEVSRQLIQGAAKWGVYKNLAVSDLKDFLPHPKLGGLPIPLISKVFLSDHLPILALFSFDSNGTTQVRQQNNSSALVVPPSGHQPIAKVSNKDAMQFLQRKMPELLQIWEKMWLENKLESNEIQSLWELSGMTPELFEIMFKEVELINFIEGERRRFIQHLQSLHPRAAKTLVNPGSFLDSVNLMGSSSGLPPVDPVRYVKNNIHGWIDGWKALMNDAPATLDQFLEVMIGRTDPYFRAIIDHPLAPNILAEVLEENFGAQRRAQMGQREPLFSRTPARISPPVVRPAARELRPIDTDKLRRTVECARALRLKLPRQHSEMLDLFA